MLARASYRTGLVLLSTTALLVTPGGALNAWMSAAALVAQSAPAAPRPNDGDWPRGYTTPDGSSIVIYQPQIADWVDQKLMNLYAAVSYTPRGATTPILGTIRAQADTRVSVEERLVDFSSLRIEQSNFPGATREQATAAVAAIKSGMQPGDRVIALDRVLESFDASTIRPKNIEGVKADPPILFYSTRPAIIINLDGDPIWSPIQNNDLRYAVNTNWDLFEHPPTKAFYLRNERVWLKAADVRGPWTAAGTLPASFSKLPADDNWNDVRAALPGQSVAASALPTVFVSTTPAELMLLTGEPQYEAVSGTQLLWVRNTESDVFRLGRQGNVYYLVAGRWFSAPDFKGPWTFASTSLPPDFARIPLEHERSRVLASVPGTVQAAEAVLLAQVPQTARVSKKEVKAPDVVYQGEPQFQTIESTSVARAVNTSNDVFKVGDIYYMCFQGVWFRSTSASGPWEVTASVPPQIYTIPVSSPSHHVTYVTVEDDDDDWVVYATAAAYTGVMVAWGCAVWGTGYYYPPYVGYGGFYPAYFPYFPTYGYSAWYNPWTGTYGRGVAAYGPYGGAGIGARYNPRTGTYARGAAAYGPYGARGVGQAYNPRTGAYGATRQGSSVYGSWGSTGVRRGDQWATTARVTNNFTGNTTRVTRTNEGGTAVSRNGPGPGGGFVGQSGQTGDVYAGRDGNVYRRQDGSWQQYGDGGWNNVPAAEPRTGNTTGQLDRDAAARSSGADRTRDASTVRSGSTTSTPRTGSTTTRSPSTTPRTGSYRPSGGMRGGGGRRR